MSPENLSRQLESILEQYQESFLEKIFSDESLQEDDLMLVYGLTQDIKAEHRQYWGRELGMCWQRLVTELCRQRCENFNEAIRQGGDELCDLVVGKDAIDTKYRIGSGDSGTLKKFRQYGQKLTADGYQPVLLILRNDNLPQALNACQKGGWIIKQGNETYNYLYSLTKFDTRNWLENRRNRFSVRDRER